MSSHRRAATATILVVDDNETARDVLSRLLERACDRVLVAADGETALDRMKAEQIDLVVADVLMPGMDGYELVRQMRSDAMLARIPVIFCTAFYLEEEAKALARAGGVVHVLAKPIETATLLLTVNEMLDADEPATPPLALVGEAAEFDHEHARLVATKLADKVAQLEELQARVVARARRAELLVSTLAAVGAAATLEDGLEALMRGAMTLIGGQRAVARVFDPETGVYLLHLRLDADGRIYEQTPPTNPQPGTFGQRLADGGAAELIGDYGALSEEQRTLQARWVMPGTASTVHVPIDAAGRRIGALHLHHATPNAFGSEELALAEALAMQAGSAIDRARLTSAGVEAQRALSESEERYRTLAESAPIGIFRTILSGEAVYVNEQWEAITGQPGIESLGYGWANAIHPEDREAAQRNWQVSAQNGAIHNDEFRVLRPDGTIRVVLANAVPTRSGGGEVTGYVGTVSDMTAERETMQQLAQITERLRVSYAEAVASEGTLRTLNSQLEVQARELEGAVAGVKAAQEMVVQQERMRAVGEMASGIAHDLNNALAPVVGFSELLLLVPGALEDITRARQYLTMIHGGAEDAAKVVARLREFYRQRGQDEVFAAVDLPKIVREVVALTQPKWKDQAQADGRTVELVMDLPDVPPVAGHEAELRELLTNLIFNAVDAMPHGGPIRLTVRHDAATDAVLTEVADSGVGMTEEVRLRCLEPFFSTKGERGTGLGLSMVHGTVQRHRGTMDVSSSIGVGSTFRVSLPVARGAQGRDPVVGSGPLRPLRVLVVDDEPAVREVTVAYLEADGHAVKQAASGREAIEALRSGGIDLLITDRAMPGMSGDQLAVAARHGYPDLPVILLTGFGGLMEATGEVPPGVNQVVGKPLTRAHLRRAVEQTSAS